MTKLVLFGTLVALAASPALAQDSMQDAMEETDAPETMDAETMDGMADGAVEMASESPEAVVVTPETVVLDAPVMDAPMMDAPVAEEPMLDMPADTDATVTRVEVACPEGTTAQDDGTCMITGDYEGDE